MISSQEPAQIKHVTKRGVISCEIDNPNFPDKVWGREIFIMTRHQSGERVLRAFCELNDDPAIIRDVFQRVDQDFHPMDAAVRLTEDDTFKGTAWYHFTDHSAEMQGFNCESGRVSAETEIDRSVRGFGNHSLMGDAWLVAKFDRSQGPRQHTFYNNPLTSMDHRGATGPLLERSKTCTFEYFGEEEITVRAGTFRCYHFAFVVVANNHPPYHLWVTADGDFGFVKGTVDAPYNWAFELVEYSET
ncbi:MAG: hypothetical protein R3265_11110 [Hyphomonas sp.]|nr:hypothetical protein [Hyphomonas sp.]